jgi:hypothetical protein
VVRTENYLEENWRPSALEVTGSSVGEALKKVPGYVKLKTCTVRSRCQGTGGREQAVKGIADAVVISKMWRLAVAP